MICLCATPSLAQPSTDPGGPSGFREWRTHREQSLRSETGYLALAGLYWLKDGSQSFGSAPENDVVFPAGRAPDLAGHFVVKNHGVTVVGAPDVSLKVNGKRISSVNMVSDSKGTPTRIQLGELTFWLIDRSGRLGIRLRDPESPILRNYKGTRSFPYAAKWLVRARFEPLASPQPISIPNILGTESEIQAEGRLTFSIDGKPYSLYPTSVNDKQFSLIFGDKTSGIETYGGGRFLTVLRPKEGDVITIDFNRAYNPPCAYSPFTTCPMAPRQNILPIRIEAGELTEGIHHRGGGRR